jgi:hypothetical protein
MLRQAIAFTADACILLQDWRECGSWREGLLFEGKDFCGMGKMD